MYYKRLNTNVTDFGSIAAIEAKNQRDEVVNTQIKIEEVVDDIRDDEYGRSKVSRVLFSLE